MRTMGWCALACALTVGCGGDVGGPSGPGCTAGQEIACTCASGASGSQRCYLDGSGFSACACGSSPQRNCAGRECGDDGAGGVCGQCATGLACVTGSCEPDPTSRWDVLILRGTVSTAIDWDTFAGGPDPQVCVTVRGNTTCTQFVDGAYAPVWNGASGTLGPFTAQDLQGTVTMGYYDNDAPLNPDTICAPGPVTFTRGAFRDPVPETLRCNNGSFDLMLRARP